MDSFKKMLNIHPITRTDLWPKDESEPCLVWDGALGDWVIAFAVKCQEGKGWATAYGELVDDPLFFAKFPTMSLKTIIRGHANFQNDKRFDEEGIWIHRRRNATD